MNKKGQMSGMSGSVWAIVGVAVAFVVVGLVVAFGNLILGDTRADLIADTTGTTATCNVSSGTYTGCDDSVTATTNSIEANNKLSNKTPLLATVIIAVIIIGLLVIGFAGFMIGKSQ